MQQVPAENSGLYPLKFHYSRPKQREINGGSRRQRNIPAEGSGLYPLEFYYSQPKSRDRNTVDNYNQNVQSEARVQLPFRYPELSNDSLYRPNSRLELAFYFAKQGLRILWLGLKVVLLTISLHFAKYIVRPIQRYVAAF